MFLRAWAVSVVERGGCFPATALTLSISGGRHVVGWCLLPAILLRAFLRHCCGVCGVVVVAAVG